MHNEYQETILKPWQKFPGQNFSKKEILARDPFCIFCGGETPSETVDHVPSKSIWYPSENRPGSHMYGACKQCNTKSSHSDHLVGAIIKLHQTVSRDIQGKDLLALSKQVSSNRFPFIDYMSKEEKIAIKSQGKIQEANQFELPYITFHLIRYWFAKIGAALYYDTIREILPAGSIIHIPPTTTFHSDPCKLITLAASLPIKSGLANSKDIIDEDVQIWTMPQEEKKCFFLVSIKKALLSAIFIYPFGVNAELPVPKLGSRGCFEIIKGKGIQPIGNSPEECGLRHPKDSPKFYLRNPNFSGESSLHKIINDIYWNGK